MTNGTLARCFPAPSRAEDADGTAMAAVWHSCRHSWKAEAWSGAQVQHDA